MSNILTKNGGDKVVANVSANLLQQAEEKALAEQVAAKQQAVAPLMAKGDYSAALSELAGLRAVVDSFFDNVMVMADDDAVKKQPSGTAEAAAGAVYRYR